MRFAPALLLVTVLSTPLFAQETPSHQRGLGADTAYQLRSLDSVNLFNGNLILTLPIGPTYPVGSDLSYGINLVYNSNGWTFDERTCLLNNAVERYAVPIPEWTSNAGFGWTVNFGRLFYPYQEPENKDNVYWVYLTPDSSRRNLYDEKRVSEGSSTSTTQLCFDRDTGFLSRQRVLAGGSPGR